VKEALDRGFRLLKRASRRADEDWSVCASLYARVKATMTLRKSGVLESPPGRWLRRLRLPVVLAGAAVVLLTTLAGGTGAGVAEYTGTLYANGGVSAVGSGNYQLSVSAGPAQGSAPTVVAGLAGTGGPSGSFTYVYVVTSGGVATASPRSSSVSPSNAPVTVSGITPGADLYRQATAAGAPIGQYILIASGVGAVYVDTSTATTGTPLPQSDNRAATGVTGWIEFAPGNSLAMNSSTTPISSLMPTPTTCKGWIVDGSGGVTLPAGTWTVQARVRSGSMTNGVAVLSAGAYVVDAGGNVVSTIFAPTDGSQQIQNVAFPGVVATVTATTTSATTIGAAEHLCLQFWRHQTTAYTLASANRYITLVPYDPANAITIHPAPNATPVATLSAPADGLRTQTIPALSATYTDGEAEAGSLTIRLCTDSGCSSSPQNSGAMPATNGATLNWTASGPLADATYYWQAQAQDALGASAWTSSRSFVIDTAAPSTSITSKPSLDSNATSGTFEFSANEAVTGYECRLDGGSFAACTSPHPYGPLSDGSHAFEVKAVADLAGNAGATTSYSWTIDTVPPNTSITTAPSALSNDPSPTFDLSATQAGSSFECSLDGAAFTSCPDPQTYSGLADGAHDFRARAVDPAGNADPTPASHSWTIDATPPDTTIGPSQPAPLTTATGATFDFSSTELPATFQCSLDGAAFTSCSSPRSYSGLADGSHTFQVRAIDTATNADSTPASYAWTIDTTPPVTSIGPAVPPANTSSSNATFDLGSNEAGSTFECRLDGGAFAGCITPASYTGLADGDHTFDVRATDPAGNVDTSPASYTWRIDNVAPATPTLVSPADANLSNATPQLRATYNDATPGDTGTIEFQLCSSSAPAGTACAPIVQSATTASISNGATASATPAALPAGTYHWQARAQDAAGNQSPWTATRSFQLDNIAPTVAALVAPRDGAWVSSVQLSAMFSKPSFAGTGAVEFRICADALCLNIVTTGTSGTVINGGTATWSPVFTLGDGLYYWQARSVDSVGNQSAWSAVRVFHVDTHAPGQPLNFHGTVGPEGLILRWDPPNDAIANYVLFVDGAPWKNFGSTEFEAKLGPYETDDTRTFSLVAVDLAGNVGATSPVLVGVPDLVGLTWRQALGVASARGLALRRNQPLFSVPMRVATQEPAVPGLAARGSSVLVTLEAARLAIQVKPRRLACAAGSVVRLRVQLSAPASVRNRLLNARGRVVKRSAARTFRAGTTTVRMKLPRGLRRGAYRLVFDATGEGGTAGATVRIKVGATHCPAVKRGR
jgi:hypothetical protein